MGQHHNRNRSIVLWSAAAFLLLLPWVAMQFTEQMAWDPGDFILLGAMLVSGCGAYELAARKAGSSAYLTAVGVAVAAAFLLIWINLAVGIIGNEENPANLMYGGVLVIAFTGSVIAGFRPRGMARAMVATAIAQLLVAVIALLLGFGRAFVLTVFFVALWLTSAWLFARAHQAQSSNRQT
jgi:hypothetical protein